MSLTPRFTLAGRKLRIAFLLPAFLLLAGCHRTLNPWMSPVAVDVQGECGALHRAHHCELGRAPGGDEEGCALSASGPVTSLPPAVHAVVAEAITGGACAAHPGLLEISRRPEGNGHFVFPTFTATWRSEEGATRNLPVKVVHLEDAGEHLVPEKALSLAGMAVGHSWEK